MKPRAKPRAEEVVFDELAQLCASPGYIEAVARFGFRDNVIFYAASGLKGDALSKTFSHERLIRTEISTLIGLMIRQPIDFTPQPSSVVDDYCARTEALLKELHNCLGSAWLAGMSALTKGDTTFNPFKNAAALREPIFYGAESAYPFQYREFAVRKYLADDAWLEKNRGFAVTTARDVVKAIQDVQRDKVMAFLEAAKGGAKPTALSALAFTLEDVARKIRLDSAKVAPVLDAFTIDQAERNATFKTLADFNAANATPLIRLDDETYVLFHTASLAEALYDGPFFWMMADKGYRSTAAENRGAFTEAFAAERLSRVFGQARVFLNVTIPGAKGKPRGEIDVLVLFGDRAIVLQAKAKRLTLEARKGNDLQLQADFKGAVQDASDQAMECAAMLLEPSVTLLDDKGAPIALIGEIRRVYPVCLVLDHYPALAFQTRQFLTVEPVEKVAPPFVIDVFALDVITEMLTSPLRLISYLELRARAGDKFLASGELTILGYHLAQNLWLGSDVDMALLTDDVAADLDAAMIVRREGAPGPRTPEGILTRLQATAVARFIADIDADPNTAVLELGLFLLELDEDGVRWISNAMNALCKAAAQDHKPHNATFPVGGAGITLHANGLADQQAMDMLRDQCRLRKYYSKADRWFGMSLDVASGQPRFGLMLEEAWSQDDAMDLAVADLAPPQVIRRQLPSLNAKKPQRNEPCYCGSGGKYKKCCLPRDEADARKRALLGPLVRRP
jgi:hypothetical protein